MNILITGGLGYIGGRVASYLKKREPDAMIYLTTRDKNRRLPHWAREFSVMQMDLLDENSIADCLAGKNIDIIIHLAALNEIESMKFPEMALEVNIKGTYKLLKIASINKINKFVYFSTFHVYDESSVSVITEDTPTRSYHPYSTTHRAAEDFVNFFRYCHNMKVLILRLSNAYGYPMHKEVNRWTLVFNDLCKQAVVTQKIFLKSSGKQHRDFISLNNVARAVHHFLYVIPDSWGDGIYNLGADCSMSILNVARKIADVYRSKYKKDILEINTLPDSDNSIILAPINYSIDKIMRTGFTLESDMVLEIEKTMNLCEEFINEIDRH